MSVFGDLSDNINFEVDVTEPTKSFAGPTVYKIILKIYEDDLLKDEIIVWKRYSEVRKLYGHLKEYYLKSGKSHSQFPTFPKKRIIGRYEKDVIEQRRRSSSRLLNFVVKDKAFANEKSLNSFFEHGTHRTLSTSSSLSFSMDDSSVSIAMSTQDGEESTSSLLDPAPSNENVWSHRQPTPDCLEADELESSDQAVQSINERLCNLPLLDESECPSNDDTTDWNEINQQEVECLNEVISDEEINVSGNDSSSSSSENEVFDENGCKIHRRSWLRHAMSVCSEGEDIEQLASEGNALELHSPPSSPMSSVREISPEPFVLPNHTASTPIKNNIDRGNEVHPNNNQPQQTSNGAPDLFTLDEKLSTFIQDTVQADDYVYHASVAMSDAIEHEVKGHFEAAFEAYKFGIGILLHGVQRDDNHERREAVRRKTASYLLRAENVYNLHCHSQVASIKTSYSSPTSTERSLPQSLHDMKVLGILDKVMLVHSCQGDDVYVVKVLRKCATVYKQKHRNGIVQKHGKSKLLNCKYMVKILSYSETSNGVYLVLQYIQSGRLWDYLGLDTRWTTSASTFKITDEVSSPRLPNAEAPNEIHVKRIKVDEDQVRIWAAEVFKCIFNLHKDGIICKDLNPRNILIDQNGHVLLTHFSNVRGIDYNIDDQAIERLYTAPEINGTFEVTHCVDYWSVGALLFELLTGHALHNCHPTGIHPHSIITLPTVVSGEAHSLLRDMLNTDSEIISYLTCPCEKNNSGVHELLECFCRSICKVHELLMNAHTAHELFMNSLFSSLIVLEICGLFMSYFVTSPAID